MIGLRKRGMFTHPMPIRGALMKRKDFQGRRDRQSSGGKRALNYTRCAAPEIPKILEMTIKNNPKSPSPKIRLEKRAGKAVTIISGLHTYGAGRLNAIAKELKITFGTGGTVKNGTIEVQGDKTASIKEWFGNRINVK